MKPIITALAVLLLLFGCKKSEDEYSSRGTLTFGDKTFEIDNGMRQISPGSIVINKEFVTANNITYTFFSNDGKNKVKVRFLTTKDQLASGDYFVNGESITISDNTAQLDYFVEEDIGQTDRISIAKINLRFQRSGEIETFLLTTKGDNKVTINWEGKL